jgi:hypothetical protein
LRYYHGSSPWAARPQKGGVNMKVVNEQIAGLASRWVSA